MQSNFLNSKRTINNIGLNILAVWCFCLLLQIIFQRNIHDFLLISGLWLFTSFCTIKAVLGLALKRLDFEFKLILFFSTFFMGLLLIFISSELLIEYRGIPFMGLDDAIYDEQQKGIASKLLMQDHISSQALMTGFYSGYPNFGGILMYLIGSNHWLVPRVATLFLFSVSTLIFYSIMKKCYTLKSSRFTSVIYGLSPMFMLYAIMQMKDSLIIFFVLLIINSVINLSLGKKYIINTIVLLVSMFCLIPIRAMVIISLLLSIICYILFSRKSHKFINFFVLIGVLFGVYILWSYASFLGLFMDPSDYYSVRMENLGSADKMAGSASILSKTGYAYLISAPLFILLSPFLPIPTALLFENPSYPNFNVDFSGNVFQYALIPYFISSVYIWIKKMQYHKATILFFALFVVYKIGSALSGMTLWSFRQTLPAILVLLMLVPLSFDNSCIIKGQKATKVLLFILIASWSLFRLFIRL